MNQNEIEELINSIKDSLCPKRIYLFGSFADQTYTNESDYDFYIVVDNKEKDVLSLTVKAYKAIRHKQKRAVDIIVNTEEHFENKKNKSLTIENEVSNKGILLYG